MILYADTSALVKKYVREDGSEQVLAFIAGFEAVATAALTYVEMAAALAKAGRQGWVDDTALQEAWRDFRAHWPAYTRLPVSSAAVERAADLAWKHGLRAYDAMHLSCAQVWQEVTGEETVFACFDQRLRQAASVEGLQVWPAAGA
ncbi:MAG: type II toxin-antitoxin system VapC family toxin [Anaerolineales bacterium]|nr:type II toxin-antitoxin system VapC family toxin [Anaerolineales bacterium]